MTWKLWGREKRYLWLEISLSRLSSPGGNFAEPIFVVFLTYYGWGSSCYEEASVMASIHVWQSGLGRFWKAMILPWQVLSLFSQVLKGLLDGIHEVAIKVFKDTSDSSQFRTFLQEVELLRHCRNSQIVQVISWRMINCRVKYILLVGKHTGIPCACPGSTIWY